MALSQNMRMAVLPHTLPQSLKASYPRLTRVLLPPHPLRQASHTYFPTCVPGADGTQLDVQCTHSHVMQVLGFADSFINGGKTLLVVYITITPSQKDGPKELETPCDIWSSPLHADSYCGFHKINCIFPGTKLEITQRAINAEICLFSAKILDKKPIRQFLPYVLEWILPCSLPTPAKNISFLMQQTKATRELKRHVPFSLKN